MNLTETAITLFAAVGIAVVGLIIIAIATVVLEALADRWKRKRQRKHPDYSELLSRLIKIESELDRHVLAQLSGEYCPKVINAECINRKDQ